MDECKSILYGKKISRFPQNTSLSSMFSKIANKYPYRIAISFSTRSLTYGELHNQSSQLAHLLIKKGVKLHTPIAVIMDKGIDFIIAVFGILKAGCFYIPIDPEYPEERIKLMLDSITLSAVITKKNILNHFGFISSQMQVPIVLSLSLDSSDWKALKREPYEMPKVNITLDSPAYLIFTSGTTGKPKGVLNTHGCVLNLVQHYVDSFNIQYTDKFSQLPSFSFDASIGEIFPCLLIGAHLRIYPSIKYTPPYEIIQSIGNDNVSVLTYAPIILKANIPFLKEELIRSLSSLKLVLIGGEPLHYASIKAWIDKFGDKVQFVNIYGPTETTVFSTMLSVNKEILSKLESNKIVPIGKPVCNTDIYILDENKQVVPLGEEGEIYIAGKGVSKGYYQMNDLTSEHFLSIPIAKCERIYKTGDLGRINESGIIEIIGRVDTQIKIRGHRVELGEVESVLGSHPSIDRCFVMKSYDHQNNVRLVCYIIKVQEVTEEDLVTFILQKLPDYMVPSRFISVNKLPMSTSGKIDKKRLPEVNWEEDINRTIIGALNDKEHVVMQIWKSVLNLKEVGRHDNFYHLGGDSISALHIVFLLKRHAYEVSLKQVMNHPVVHELASILVKKIDNILIESHVSGDCKFSAIQHWFFEMQFDNPHFYHQSMEFEANEILQPELIEQSLNMIIKHHDQLRAEYHLKDGAFSQKIRSEVKPLRINTYNISGYSEDLKKIKIKEIGMNLRNSIKLDEAPLIKVGLIQLSNTKSRLICVVHHLIIDTVSWHIISNDLYSSYYALKAGRQVKLFKKTSSYQKWSSWVENKYIFDREFVNNQVGMWRHVLKKNIVSLIPNSHLNAKLVLKYSSNLSIEQTTELVKNSWKCYNTTTEDMIITALYRAISQWSGQNEICIDIEWNGRKNIDEASIDITGTVGWFTAIYPFIVKINVSESIQSSIIKIKETLSTSREHGISFGRLRYLTQQKYKIPEFEGYKSSEIVFNFSGVIQEKLEDWTVVQISAVEKSPENNSPYPMAIESYIKKGHLKTDFYYHSEMIDENKIIKLSKLLVFQLEQLIQHCSNPKNYTKTPSDFNGCQLTMKEVKALPSNTVDAFPLSDLQSGFYFFDLKNPNSQMYKVQIVYHIQQPLEKEIFKKAFEILINRHDILRTRIAIDGLRNPLQIVLDSIKLDFQTLDASGKNYDEEKEIITSFLEKDGQKKFDLTNAPLIRGCIVITSQSDSFKFILTIHHMIHDGWSLTILMDELQTIYHGLLNNQTWKLPDIQTTFKDYVLFQQKIRENLNKIFYWQKKFQDIQISTIPSDYPISQIDDDRKSIIVFRYLTDDIYQRIKQLAIKKQVTLNAVFLTAYAILLRNLMQVDQIILGIVTSGRSEEIVNYDRIIGCCTNTLPLIISFNSVLTTGEMIQHIQSEVLELNEHLAFPLSEILKIARNKDKNRPFQLFNFIYDYESYRYISNNEVKKAQIVDGFEMTSYGFELNVQEKPSSITFNFTYCPGIYKPETIKRWISFFEKILRQLPKFIEQPFHKIPYMPNSEKQLLEKFNGPKVHIQKFSIYHFLEIYADKTPEKVAVKFEGQTISYSELNKRTNQLAHYLIKVQGVQKDQLIAVLLKRSINFVYVIMGIWKAGAAYIPIDPDYPDERINIILEDSSTSLLISNQSFYNRFDLKKLACKIIKLEELEEKLISYPETNLKKMNHMRSLSYVIYTSGSTGTPKGAMVEHLGMMNNIHAKIRDYQLTSDSKIAQTASQCFDISVWQLFTAFVVGGTTVIYSKNLLLDLENFVKRAFDYDLVTTVELVPSYIIQLLEYLNKINHPLPSLNILSITGEALKYPLLKNWLKQYPQIPVVNAYGPAEASDDCTHHFFTEAPEDQLIPIGKPIQNMNLYIVDREMKLCPIGVVGEICVSGIGVGRGYVNNPIKTKEVFMLDPFRKNKYRFYKTGDLGRWRADGVIEFFGRKDYQVKVNGFRIELEEIECQLSIHPYVNEVAVVLSKDENLKGFLSAWLTVNKPIETSDLRAYIKNLFPFFMVPQFFTILEKMPLTPNGKIDRIKLSTMEPIIEKDKKDNTPALTSTQEALVAVWTKIFKKTTIGIHDNFFNFGGDSIKAIQISVRLKELGYKLNINDLFRCPTIAELSFYLKAENIVCDQSPVTGPLINTPAISWFFDQQFEEPNHWNQAVLLFNRNGFDENLLKPVIKKLSIHHDAFRAKVDIKNSTITIYDIEEIVPKLTVYNYLNKKHDKSIVESLSEKAQAEIQLENGSLVKLVLINFQDGSFLTIVIHHLIIDGISWRILLEDFSVAYQQLADGRPIKLPLKSNSFIEWSNHLSAYAINHEIKREYEYWQKICSSPNQFNFYEKHGLYKNAKNIFVQLSKEDSAALKEKVHYAYNTQMNDILLTALSLAVYEWKNIDSFLINLEGHGREEIIKNIDVSRTVGWFTSEFPVSLSVESRGRDIEKQIINIKEMLHNIPNKGIGYGILKYLSDLSPDKQEQLNVAPQISFNYLGEEADKNSDHLFSIEYSGFGSMIGANNKMVYMFDINGMMYETVLCFDFTFDSSVCSTNHAEQFAKIFIQKLSKIICYCVNKDNQTFTPSDFGAEGLDTNDLNYILNIFESSNT